MSDARTLDTEARRRIGEELLTNILVEAGAGSGKTQMLAERMAAGVANGAYEIEHMAAVTFTRKAASELRGRFHLALEKQLNDLFRSSSSNTADAARIERLQRALSNLERFFAGTIHSFCARLLRERPVESGVSPGFVELDELQDLELRKRAWRDFIASARAAGDPDMMALVEAEVRPKDLDFAFATICLHEDVLFPAGTAARPDPAAAWKALEEFWKALQKHLPATIPADTSCKIQKAARTFRGQLKVSRYRLDRPAVVAALLDTWDCESRITQKWWADTRPAQVRFRDVINPLHEEFCSAVVAPYLREWRQYVYRLSVTLLARAREYAERERRRLNSLNYGDLLNLTARVLRNDVHVRRALQQKYRHLFVDEFQDTDPVQAEIVFLLAAEEGSTESAPGSRRNETADWQAVRLRPGALFVVGDPKQSIYRFRRADIEIYNTVRARFGDPAIGRVLTLTTNFRSVPALCGWANEVFETRFPALPTSHSPRFAALDPHGSRPGSENAGTPPVKGVFALTHTCDNVREVLPEDAARIARYIRSEVDANRRKYSDFMILTRKKRDRIAAYATALEVLDIPIEVSGAGAFGESAEVKALTGLLRALADPQDALSLVAVLRGPFFGVSDRELFAFKEAGGWFSIFAQTGEQQDALADTDATDARGRAANCEPRTAVDRAFATLRQYHRWTRVLPAAPALERILEHTGYLALAATTPGGVEAGDLLHAVDRVRQVVEEGGSLSDAADALEADSDDSSEVESLPLEPGRTDVVRIMNLHKAKGLEAAVVFLADPCGGFEPRVDVHIRRTGSTAQGWFQIVRKSERQYGRQVLAEHADWATHETAERPYVEHEIDRLLYVAATRARQMLIVSRWTGNNRTPAWGALNGFLADAKEIHIPHDAVAPPVPVLDCSLEAQAEAHAIRAAAHQQLAQPSWSVTSATAEAKHVVRMTRATGEAAADDPTIVVGTNTATHRADAGMAWGTLIHGLLEHAMRHQDSKRADLRRLALWLTVEEPQLRHVIGEAIDTVQRIAGAEFWQAAQSAEHCEETPFAVADGAGTLTNGVIDLLFKSAGGWQIRDYKTDVALDASAYERQLHTYVRALRRIGLESVDASLVNVRAQMSIDAEEPGI
jgi:ATP-dependent helicase/nuclease subunit A